MVRLSIVEALNDLAEEVYSINLTNGWFDRDRAFGDDIALINSEAAELYEIHRAGIPLNRTWWDDGKMQGGPSELADIIVRVLDTAKRYNVDIGKAVRDKLENNERRGYRHGNKVV